MSAFGVVLKSLPRIERLDLAVVTLPDWHPKAPNQPTAPVYGYVIVHPDSPILFDTGVGFGNAFIDEVYEPECVRLDEALGAVGIDASSIVGVVNSHLHFDHCGQNPLLYGTDVPFFVHRHEVDEVERDRFYTDQGGRSRRRATPAHRWRLRDRCPASAPRLRAHHRRNKRIDGPTNRGASATPAQTSGRRVDLRLGGGELAEAALAATTGRLLGHWRRAAIRVDGHTTHPS